jgi:hypothetical protein
MGYYGFVGRSFQRLGAVNKLGERSQNDHCYYVPMEGILQACQEMVKETGQEAETHGSTQNPTRTAELAGSRYSCFLYYEVGF